ncbi:MAG TPA: hypothetical protein VGH44_00105 [Candidatus Saccharimonadia bacterium]
MSTLLSSHYVEPAELAAFTDAELKAALHIIAGIENEFRGPSWRTFRRWFVRAELGLSCAFDAPAALAELIPPAELSSVGLQTMLGLRPALLDYLTFPGLDRDLFVNIVRTQLGLPVVNGSVPPEWSGLSFADMVRAHLGCITSREAKLVIAKIIAEQELDIVSDSSLLSVLPSVQSFLRNPAPEPYRLIGEQVFIDMVRVHLGLSRTGYLPADVIGGQLSDTLREYITSYGHELRPGTQALATLPN